MKLTRTRLAAPMALVIALAFSAVTHAADAPARFTLTPRDGAIRVELDGKLFTEYLYKGWPKPILYPILGPGGVRVTRDFPMKETAGEPLDHPHHQSFWFTHGSVNGIDFWATQTVASATPDKKLGITVHDKLVKSEAAGDHAVITTHNKWNGPDGKTVLTDSRTMTFSVVPGTDERMIDFEITLRASEGDVTFGDSKEGTMGIRTIPALQLKAKPNTGVVALGKMINSENQDGNTAWGKRAKWLDYWAPIDGKTLGIAVFDHPSNPRHPSWWHARDYGLITANPFGQHDFGDGPEHAGDMLLKKGDSVTFRYRFIFHVGDAAQAKIAERYQDYSGGK